MQVLEQRLGGFDADIGAEQQSFEFFEKLGIELTAAAQQLVQVFGQRPPGSAKALAQPPEQAGASVSARGFGQLHGNVTVGYVGFAVAQYYPRIIKESACFHVLSF